MPTDVMLGWAGCETTRATLALATLPTRFEELRFERPEAFPMYRKLVTVERFEVPETFRSVRIPTDVTFGWAGCETTRATFALATFPTRFEELRFERPEAFPMYRKLVTVERFEVPETFRSVRIPTDVTLGWAGCETTRATFALATLPTRFEELRFERPEAFPMYRKLVTVERFEVPETFRLVKIPTDVTLGWAGWETTRATLALATLPTRFEELRFESPEAFPM